MKETTILTFHGLCEGAGDPDILDWTLHLPVEVFHNVCRLLAENYRVISMAELVEARSKNLSLPDHSVVITFDDGFESNYKLGYPILKSLGLPATIYATTGFLDGDEMMWFQRMDLAFGRTFLDNITWKINNRQLSFSFDSREQRQKSLGKLMSELKLMPDADLLGEVDRLEAALNVTPPTLADLPVPMRPLSWDMAREMISSGLIEIGGHSHTHPILSRCDPVSMRAEIITCRDRIRDETGVQPASFAYPNGGPEDYTRETMLMVREAGFQSACTLINGRIDDHASLFQLQRYGCPESVWEAEATVSGAFETLKQWRQSCLKALSLI